MRWPRVNVQSGSSRSPPGRSRRSSAPASALRSGSQMRSPSSGPGASATTSMTRRSCTSTRRSSPSCSSRSSRSTRGTGSRSPRASSRSPRLRRRFGQAVGANSPPPWTGSYAYAGLALKLENEFVVDAPVGPTWKTLLDLERVAGCLPGATIEPVGADGTYKGSMRVKLGPMSMNYAGTAKLESVDESEHTAVFAVHGKETRGQGSATATIRNRLVPEGNTTRVVVETELSVTGRPAQFGRGIMQD